MAGAGGSSREVVAGPVLVGGDLSERYTHTSSEDPPSTEQMYEAPWHVRDTSHAPIASGAPEAPPFPDRLVSAPFVPGSGHDPALVELCFRLVVMFR